MFNLFEMYQTPGLAMFLFLIATVWTLIWKGMGLWFAARNRQKGWFIAMLVLNTLGLLPIIYLLWFKPKSEEREVGRFKIELTKEAAAKKNKLQRKKIKQDAIKKKKKK